MAAYDEEGISRFSWYGVVASIQKISCLVKFFGPKSVTTLLQWIITLIVFPKGRNMFSSYQSM
jgi:hypothetical protein